MTIKVVQNTFSAGEVSNEAINRIDLDFYQKAASELKNVYVNSTGNLVKREGSLLLNEVNGALRIECFSFNGLQDYCLVFFERGIDVYYNDLKTAEIVLSLTAEQIKELDYAQYEDTVLLFHKGFPTKKIIRKSHSLWELSDVSWENIPYYAYGDLTSTRPASTVTFSTSTKKTKITFGSNVAQISWVGQKIYLNKGGVVEIYKYDSGTICWGNWKVSPPNTDVVPSQEWEIETGYTPLFASFESYAWSNGTEITYTKSANPPVDEYIYSDKYLTNEFRRITEGLVGAGDDTIYVEDNYERNANRDIVGNRVVIWWAWKKKDSDIIVYTVPNAVIGDFVYTESRTEVLGLCSAITSTLLSVKIEYTRDSENDYLNGSSNPATGCFGKGRLFVGGIKGIESAILVSNIDDYFNFDLGTAEDDNGILYKLDTYNPIDYLTFSQTLIANTSNSEHFLEYTNSTAITPSNFNMISSSVHGTSVRPFDMDGITIFIEKSGKIVRSFIYDDVQRNYTAENLSVLCPHLVKKVKRVGVRKSSYYNPNNVAYMLNEDGTITLFNLLREQKFKAFSRCETNGLYQDVASVNDKVYCLCDRVIAGATKRFLERFDTSCDLDCSIKKESPENATEWAGLEIFEGHRVDVIGDYYFYSGDFLVEDGKITGVVGLDGQQTDYLGLDDGFKNVEIGFGYIVSVTPAPIEYTTKAETTSFGKDKRLVYVNTKCIDTLGISIVSFNHTYKTSYLRFGDKTLNNELKLETGFKKTYCGGFSKILEFTITQEFPAKFNLVSMEVGVE